MDGRRAGMRITVSTQNGGSTDVVFGAQGIAGTGLAGVGGWRAFGARG